MDIHLDCPGSGDNINIFGGYTFNTKYGNVPAYCLNETRTIIKDILKNICELNCKRIWINCRPIIFFYEKIQQITSFKFLFMWVGFFGRLSK